MAVVPRAPDVLLGGGGRLLGGGGRLLGGGGLQLMACLDIGLGTALAADMEDAVVLAVLVLGSSVLGVHIHQLRSLQAEWAGAAEPVWGLDCSLQRCAITWHALSTLASQHGG